MELEQQWLPREPLEDLRTERAPEGLVVAPQLVGVGEPTSVEQVVVMPAQVRGDAGIEGHGRSVPRSRLVRLALACALSTSVRCHPRQEARSSTRHLTEDASEMPPGERRSTSHLLVSTPQDTAHAALATFCH